MAGQVPMPSAAGVKVMMALKYASGWGTFSVMTRSEFAPATGLLSVALMAGLKLVATASFLAAKSPRSAMATTSAIGAV